MKPARENHERLAGVADAVTVAAVDMAVAAKVASEEATDEFANHGSCGRDWAGLDSNQRRRKASRFTVCPVWPLRYLPSAFGFDLLAEKFRDAIYHVLLGLARDFRIDRQCERFTRRALRFREVSRFVTEIFETRLFVQRERIVNRRFHFALRKMFAQLVTLRRANHVLVINVMVL